MNDFEIVKDKISLESWISRNYKSKNLGTGKIRLDECPIHGCGHRDCFTVYIKSQSWKCFSCGNSGDIFGFLTATGRANSRYEALQILAKEVNVELHKGLKDEIKKIDLRAQIFTETADFYFNNMPEKATKYLREKRNRSTELIYSKHYGWAGKKSLYKHLLEKKYTKEQILSSGICKRKMINKVKNNPSAGKREFIWDTFFDNKLIYPIYYHGRICDFHCKDPFKDKKERHEYQLENKYKLYNVMFKNQEALNLKEFILVEGLEDIHTVMQYTDIPVVAIFGQLSPSQITYMEKYCTDATIYMAFDKDAAGNKYNETIYKTLLGSCTLKRLAWPGTDDIDAYLNEEIDPASTLKQMIEFAPDAIEYEIAQLPEFGDKLKPTERSARITPIIAMIAISEDLVVIDSYTEMLSIQMATIRSKTDDDEDRVVKKKQSEFSILIKKMIASKKGIFEQIGDIEEEPDYGIYEKNNCLWMSNKKGTHRLANFIIRVTQIIEENEEYFYEVELTNNRGEVARKFKLSSEDRVNYRKFKVACGKQGSFYYEGKDEHLGMIWQKEELRNGDIPIVCYHRRYGYLDQDNLWLFNNCAIQGNQVFPADDEGIIRIGRLGYKSQGVVLYSNDSPILNLEFKPNAKYLKDIIQNYWTMFDHRNGNESIIGDEKVKAYSSFRGFMAMGYLAAMAWRPEWLKHDNKFPNLFAFGPVRSGKSETIQLLMRMMGWHNEGHIWKITSVVGIANALEHLSCLPLWIEEYTNSSDNDKNHTVKVEMVRGAYNMSGRLIANTNGRTRVTAVNTNFIFSGQDYLTDKGAQTRTVGLRKEKPTEIGSESFRYLKNEEKRLSSIFLWLLLNKDKAREKTLRSDYVQIKSHLKAKVKEGGGDTDDRALTNYGMLAASFLQFGYYEYQNEFLAWMVGELTDARTRENEADIVTQFFTDMENTVVKNFQCYFAREKDVLHMHFSGIYAIWRTYTNRQGSREYISAGMLRDYLAHHPSGFWLGRGRTKIRNSEKWDEIIRVNTIMIDISKLPSDLKEMVDDWGQSQLYAHS